MLRLATTAAELAPLSPCPDAPPSAAHSPREDEGLHVAEEEEEEDAVQSHAQAHAHGPAAGAAASAGAENPPLALIACRICQEPIRRSVSSIRADACCHICYTGLWRDAIRVAAALKRHRSLSVPGTTMATVLDLFKQEMTQVGKPCVRTDGSCAPADYHYSTPRIRRCTRCRTKAAIQLFPEVAYRLLTKAHQSLLKAEHSRRKNSDVESSSGSDAPPRARPRVERHAAPVPRPLPAAPAFGAVPSSSQPGADRLVRVPAMVPLGYSPAIAGVGAPTPAAFAAHAASSPMPPMAPFFAPGAAGLPPAYWPLAWPGMPYGFMPMPPQPHPHPHPHRPASQLAFAPAAEGSQPAHPPAFQAPPAPWPFMYMPAPGSMAAPTPVSVPAPGLMPPTAALREQRQ